MNKSEKSALPPPLDDLCIGLVGAGENTRRHHIPGLQALPGVRIAGVCNRTAASSRRVADAFSISKTYSNWKEAVSDPETQAIVIGTWPDLHARVSIAALDAGKHVLCEARMARNLSEARAMLAAAQRHPELVAQLVPAPFTLGVDATVRRLLAEGWLGEPLAVECRFPGGFLDRHAPLHWRQDMEISGFNIGMLGIAYETVLRWIGAATRVVALSRTFVRMRPDAEHRLREIRIPDHLDVLAEMACGAQLHFRHSPATALAPGPGFWLYGSEGTLRIHENALSGARRGETALSPIAIPESERGGWRVEEEFVGAIRGTEPVRLTTFAEGVRYMEFVEAVSRSLTEERVIPLPLA